MRNQLIMSLSVVLAAGAIATLGCSRPTVLGANTGVAYGEAKLSQILNPEAGAALEPVTGLDGPAARTTMETYRKTFENPDANFNRSLVTTGVQTK